MEDNGHLEIRRQAILAAAAVSVASLLLAYLPPAGYALLPRCPLRFVTGWLCPGCGSTHAIAALLGGRWSEAIRDNPLAVALAPVLAAYAAIEFYSALRWNRWRPIAVPPRATAFALAVTVLFGLLRNMPLDMFHRSIP